MTTIPATMRAMVTTGHGGFDKLAFHDSSISYNAGALGLLYFLSQGLWRIPAPGNLTGFLSILPLAAAQKTINDLNRELGFPEPKAEIRIGTVVAAGLGGLFWLVVLAGLFYSVAE